MASVNWLKMTKQRAGAMKTHNGKEERVQRNHSNPNIDKNKSNLNYYIGCDDYVDAYQAMCRRVEEVDKIYPPKRERKDRKICVSLEAKCPQSIFDEGRHEEFFEKTYQLFQNFFGAENVHGSCVHLDEMHPYIEDGVKKMSLAHSTTLVSAYTEWTEKESGEKRKGISASKLESRARLTALNRAMCDMVRREFGVEYNTGEKAKHKTVEQLKAQSELEEMRKANDDFVRSLVPTPTKTTKNIIGKQKEIPKTEAELQRDREVLAAQAILKREDKVAKKEKQLEQEREELKSDREQFDQYVAEREIEYTQKEAAMHEDFQRQLVEQTDKFKERLADLTNKNTVLEERLRWREVESRISQHTAEYLLSPPPPDPRAGIRALEQGARRNNSHLRKEQKNGNSNRHNSQYQQRE